MPKIGLPKITMRYDEHGAGSPVILLHGLPGDASSWDPVLDGLAGFRLLAVDQRGQGGSSRPGEYSFELMRDDVLDFADALGLERFALVGHSMGGTVACLFAARYPERVTELVLVDSPAPREPVRYDLPPRPAEPAPYDWELFPAIFAQLADPDPAWWAGLGQITARTLVLGGGSTSPVDGQWLADLVAEVPGARLVTVEGAGHRVHGSRPAEFLAAVAPFLRGQALTGSWASG